MRRAMEVSQEGSNSPHREMMAAPWRTVGPSGVALLSQGWEAARVGVGEGLQNDTECIQGMAGPHRESVGREGGGESGEANGGSGNR